MSEKKNVFHSVAPLIEPVASEDTAERVVCVHMEEEEEDSIRVPPHAVACRSMSGIAWAH